MKFRKKPIVVEAEEFDPAAGLWPAGVYKRSALHLLVRLRLPAGDYFVWNERGDCWQRVEPGDWIIHGISGCRYPCKREIFPQIYEAVERVRWICTQLGCEHWSRPFFAPRVDGYYPCPKCGCSAEKL